jgi:hypothetical protein
MVRKYLWILVALLAACSAKAPGGSGGNKNGGATAGTVGAGASGGVSGFGSDGFAGNTASAGTGVVGDGGMCEVGKFCASNTPDPDNCGTLELKGDVTTTEMPGNVLMVFDRSGSMTMDWNGMMRWQAAGGAMIAALTPLQDKLTIGAVFYPNNGLLSCLVDPITNADQIDFMPGPMALAKMQAAAPSGAPTPLYSALLGQTPTMEGIQVADTAIAGATLTGTLAVIIVTDGEPNCMWNQATAIGLVSGWLAKGIKTHVLGIPGAGGGNGPALLNAIATAGGTMNFIEPSDPAALAMKIKDIVEQTVSKGIDSCTINFDPVAMTPEKLALAVTIMGVESAVPHEYPGGEKAWTVTPDGKTVELLGNTCAAAKNGTYSSLRFVFGCEDLPPAPPPPNPD